MDDQTVPKVPDQWLPFQLPGFPVPKGSSLVVGTGTSLQPALPLFLLG